MISPVKIHKAPLLLFAVLTAGCATESPRGYSLGDTDALQAYPVSAQYMPGPTRPKPDPKPDTITTVDTSDPALRVSYEALSGVSDDKSWIPKRGAISQTTWQLARKRDGEVIDACAKKYRLLRNETLRVLGELRAE